MSTRKLATSPPSCLRSSCGASVAFAEAPNLGKPIDPADIAAWDISVLPTAPACRQAAARRPREPRSTRQKCAACHGQDGKGGQQRAGRRGADHRHRP